jgi:hypothetical protein
MGGRSYQLLKKSTLVEIQVQKCKGMKKGDGRSGGENQSWKMGLLEKNETEGGAQADGAGS